MDQIATAGHTPLPARPLTALHRGVYWYFTAAYYIVAAQTAALLVFIASLRTQAQEHLAAQHGLDASIARGLAFFLTLGTATAGDMQRQRLLASAIRFETTTVSHLAWFLCWTTLFFLTVTVAANRDSPMRFTVGTIRRLIGISLIFLFIGLFAPLIVMSAQPTIPVIGRVVYKFQSKTIASAIAALFSSGNWIIGILIGIFSVASPAAKLIAARIAVGNVSIERRQRIKRILDSIGKWSMADVFVVAVFLACFAISATDHSTQAKPQWGFYYFVGYCLTSMVVSYALGHIASEDDSLVSADEPKGARTIASQVARIVFVAVGFLVSGYAIIDLTLGHKVADSVASSLIHSPAELHRSNQRLRAHSTLWVPFSLPYAGTMTVDVRVPQGNGINVYVISADQLEALKRGGKFAFIRGFAAIGTKNYRHAAPMAEGAYAVVLRDTTLGILSQASSEVEVRVNVAP